MIMKAYINGNLVDLTEQQIQEYEQSQNTIVPDKVTPLQARKALLAVGLLDTIESAIEAISDPEQKRLTRMSWEFATAIYRNDPLISSMAATMGMTSQQIDQLFIDASKI